MAIRKNKRFIDPRYFMDEKMERLDEAHVAGQSDKQTWSEKKINETSEHIKAEDGWAEDPDRQKSQKEFRGPGYYLIVPKLGWIYRGPFESEGDVVEYAGIRNLMIYNPGEWENLDIEYLEQAPTV